MTRLALRGLAARKLRTSLTIVAVLLALCGMDPLEATDVIPLR